ncbi:MAG: arginine--tRNA ligase [Candidatus Cloacimonadota bacterium]|nr:arginine--tRNA ligase [Candidatus Cloacimonadota bacterium]
MFVDQIQKKLQKSLIAAGFKKIAKSLIEVKYPKMKKYGDYSSNIALKIGKKYKKNPLEIAKILSDNLRRSTVFSKVEAVQPGFINFYISNNMLRKTLQEIHEKKNNFGTNTSIGAGKKILLEFVSANPTGPLNVVNARAAAYGDSLANIFKKLGYNTEKEYYINDAGHQIDLLVESVEVELRRLENMQVQEMEDGYKGEYVIDIAKDILESVRGSVFHFSAKKKLFIIQYYALRNILANQKRALERFNVKFDNWISEKELRAKGSVEDVLTYLSETGYTFEKDDAVWVETSKFGDSKDRVIMKSDGTTTYLVPDLAYHISKYKRNYHLMIDVLGPDHHGHVSKLKSGLKILSYDIKKLNVIILQQVNLLLDEEKVKMSKRAGNVYTLNKLINEVGTDAARFFFLMRKTNTPLDFDLDLAKKQSSENPVYYVQYAHARINSLIKMAKSEKLILDDFKPEYLKKLKHAEEMDLVRNMMKYPEMIAHIGKTYDVNLMTTYLMDLASAFHKFYHKRKIINLRYRELSLARLYLADVVKIVLANGLGILGIKAPKKM